MQVRLRIGLHRGRPALTDAGYVGLAVHAGARICSAGHGGQVVVSSGVRNAVEQAMPDGVGLAGLGTWRLQGLPRPEELFQVVADELETEFPPPRNLVVAS